MEKIIIKAVKFLKVQNTWTILSGIPVIQNYFKIHS